MELSDFLEQTSQRTIPIGDLTSIAATRAAAGDDVAAAFRTQIEQRSNAAQAVLTAAEQANRDTLLASEQRAYDVAMRERDSILALQRAVEQRTEQRAYVPETQVTRTDTSEPLSSPVLGSEQRMQPWLQSRGRYAYQGETGVDRMRLGALVAAMATGNRSHLTDLEKRALSEGTDSAGGFTVPEIVSSAFIDRVRDALVVQKAGARIMPMSSDTQHLARVKPPGLFVAGAPTVNAATGNWKLENDLIEESDLALERVTLTAKTLPLLLKMSVELFEDSPNISEIVEQEMAASTALELDRVALVGSGTPPEPKGILNQTGILTGVLATPADWDFMIDAAGQAWAVNHEPTAAIYGVATALALAKLKTATEGLPLAMPSALSGIRQYRSAAAGTRVFLGDFSQLLIGMRTSFRVEVSRTGAGAFERLQIAVRSYLRADIAVAHANAFVVLTPA